MTWADAVDIAVVHTGHERYRWLCSEDNPDAEQRESYRGFVLMRAGELIQRPLAPGTVSLTSSLRAVRRGHRNCLYAEVPATCGCVKCWAGGRRPVSLADCVECLRSVLDPLAPGP